jgi:hypothetical protein
VWNKVEENLIKLTELNNIRIRPGLTIGAWNVYRLPEIIEHLISIGIINQQHQYLNFFINLLQLPKHYHVSILNDTFRQKTIEKIERFIELYDKKYQTNVRPNFVQILHELTVPQNLKELDKFKQVTLQLDQLRKEDTYTTIPELLVAI